MNTADQLWIAIHVIALTCHLSVIDRAEVNTADQNEWTPLPASAVDGYKEIVELSLTHEAEVNIADQNGRTTQHIGAVKGHKKVFEPLLSHRAKVNTVNTDGCSPIHIGAESGYRSAEINVQSSELGGQITEVLQKLTEVTSQLMEIADRLHVGIIKAIQKKKVKSQMGRTKSRSSQDDVTRPAVTSSNPTTCKTEDCISSELSSSEQSLGSLQQPSTDSSTSWQSRTAASPERPESPSTLPCALPPRLKALPPLQSPSNSVPQPLEAVSTSQTQQCVTAPISVDQIIERLERLRQPLKEMVQSYLGDCGVLQDQSSVEFGLERWNGTINVNTPISIQQTINKTTNKYYRKTYHNNKQVSCQNVNVKKADIVHAGGTMDVHQHLPEGDDHEEDEDENLYETCEEYGSDNNCDSSSDSEGCDENIRDINMEDEDMKNYIYM